MHYGTAEAIPLPHGVKFRISVPETVVDSLSFQPMDVAFMSF